jgi:hypothetical protein
MSQWSELRAPNRLLTSFRFCVKATSRLVHNCQSQSHFTAESVSQSVGQYVLESSPLCGRLTRCCFLSKNLGLGFVVLSLWGALPDERPGLSFVSQSHFTADSESVSQPASQSVCGHLTRYCFLFKSFGPDFVVPSLWGALSDERPGPSFVSHSPVICLCVDLLFTLLSFTHLPYTYNIYKASFIGTQLERKSGFVCRGKLG